MNTITYRLPQIGDEHQISGCMWASAVLWELTDGTPESVAEWKKLCSPEELRDRILSGEKVFVATWNEIIVGFIAFKRGNHLSLLFVRREFAGQGIGRELFARCSDNLDEVTVNAAESAVGFYQKVGFIQYGDRFFKHGIWGTPMKWSNISDRVTIDGKSEDSKEYIDCPPEFITDVECLEVLNELISREPLFHHPEFGTTREDFENMTDLAFWEVGASGRRYSREYTLAEVVKRYENPQYLGIHSPPENAWETKDFHCREISSNTYLLTYTLVQEDRVTRRSTLWQRIGNDWKILYHQGTTVRES